MPTPSSPIRFLNVDLDLTAPEGFDAIIAALDGVAFDLHEDMEPRPRSNLASFELINTDLTTPDSIIAAFINAVESFPPNAKRQWDAASARVFNIGVESGSSPRFVNWRLSRPLVERIAALGASIEFTVYAADPESSG